ncbi:MAG: ribosome recycling factor [Clostridia bacterium]|jgi:ribosome recycling factor|nr:ribosome recycling factor [Clostridia bacterium]MDD4571677.1 ribosome recycling factor [Clostridia bacterium]
MTVIEDIMLDGEDRMEKVLSILCQDFATLRVGRANPSILDKVTVDYYGVATPINQTASISVQDARTLMIQPWDKNTIGLIEKAILKSDLGLNPNNDGTVLRITIPQLTEERRKELVKQVKKKTEDARVSIRNIRRDLNDKIKAAEKKKEVNEDELKEALDNAQKLTDKSINKVDEVLAKKEKEIMEV